MTPYAQGHGAERRRTFGLVAGLGLVLASMLALPARTVTTVYVND